MSRHWDIKLDKYEIDVLAFRELKYFCMQYPRAYIGCHETILSSEQYCSRHAEIYKCYQAARQSHYDKTVRLVRDAALHAFYLSQEWHATKSFINQKFKGLCAWSYLVDHAIVAADAVHHIEPIREAWNKRLELSNLIPLSHTVHMKVEAAYRSSEKKKAQAQSQLFELLRRWEKEFSPPQG